MKIHVISLKDSIQRREQVTQTLASIPFEFFDAENIKQNPEHFIFSLYNAKKTQQLKGYQLTTPELGCFASHISLWRQCVADNENYLILEDNIELLGNLQEQLINIEQMITQYPIIKLSYIFERSFIKIEDINSKYQIISHKKGACGTSAYAITPQAAQNYLNQINGFFEPVDDFMDNEWRTKQTIYSYYPALIARSQTASTIGMRKDKIHQSLCQKLCSEVYRSYKKIRQDNYNKKYKTTSGK